MAALDLHCIMQNLLLACKDSLVARELSSWQHAGLVAVWTLVPWAGIKPTSPALPGGFLTTRPPGKSPGGILYTQWPEAGSQAGSYRGGVLEDCDGWGWLGTTGGGFKGWHFSRWSSHFIIVCLSDRPGKGWNRTAESILQSDQQIVAWENRPDNAEEGVAVSEAASAWERPPLQHTRLCSAEPQEKSKGHWASVPFLTIQKQHCGAFSKVSFMM